MRISCRIILIIGAMANVIPAASGPARPLPEQPQVIMDRAVADFQAGRIAESVRGFDNLVKQVPAIAPELWQRGIALYYAGRYNECRAQFESHRTVNPNDVENAAWHFLCVARSESMEKARNALLPVGQDARIPMLQIYDMFRGKRTPQEVLASAGSQLGGQFYARLYVALFFEASGNERMTLEHMTVAASDRFATVGGYMHGVAKVHLRVVQQVYVREFLSRSALDQRERTRTWVRFHLPRYRPQNHSGL